MVKINMCSNCYRAFERSPLCEDCRHIGNGSGYLLPRVIAWVMIFILIASLVAIAIETTRPSCGSENLGEHVATIINPLNNTITVQCKGAEK